MIFWNVFLISSPTLSASDAVTLLVSANLFTEAVKIAKAYGLDYRPIVEGLTSRCIYLSRAKPSEKDVAWLVSELLMSKWPC